MAFPPKLCFRFPWSPKQESRSPTPCTLEAPFLIKSLQTVHWLLRESVSKTLDLASKSFRFPQTGLGALTYKNSRLGGARSPDEQWELEQRALASALASRKEATVIEFYSPRCRLCNSLLDLVKEVESRNDDWLSIVMIDAENEKWLPELLHYDIKYVPCFVMVDKNGRALAKTGDPLSRLLVVAGLSQLLQMKQPKIKGKPSP